METYVIRMWVPDRPGALGSVASRIGAVRGDVVGIDILERGDGLAVDELAVELPSPDVVDLLVREVSEVDGVHVEDVRLASDRGHDPRLDALETAAILIGATDADGLITALCDHGLQLLGAEWMAVVDLGSREVLTGRGAMPATSWLLAFLDGSRLADESGRNRSAVPGLSDAAVAPADIAWAPLAGADLAVAIGRTMSIRAREQQQLAALARIADARLSVLRRDHRHASTAG